MRSYKAALAIRPDFAPAWNNLGAAYLDGGDYERSITAFESGLRWDRDDLNLNVGLVLAYLGKGDITAARDHRRLLERKNDELAELIGSLIEWEAAPDGGQDRP